MLEGRAPEASVGMHTSKEGVGAVKTAPGRADGAGVGQDVEGRIPSVLEVESPGLGDSQVWARQ